MTTKKSRRQVSHSQEAILFLAGNPRSPYQVLDALRRLGGTATWTRLIKECQLGQAHLQQALVWLNMRGFVAGRPKAKGKRRYMAYSVTIAGDEILRAYRSGIVACLRLNTRIVGLDRVPAFREEHPWLFLHDDADSPRRTV